MPLSAALVSFRDDLTRRAIEHAYVHASLTGVQKKACEDAYPHLSTLTHAPRLASVNLPSGSGKLRMALDAARNVNRLLGRVEDDVLYVFAHDPKTAVALEEPEPQHIWVIDTQNATDEEINALPERLGNGADAFMMVINTLPGLDADFDGLDESVLEEGLAQESLETGSAGVDFSGVKDRLQHRRDSEEQGREPSPSLPLLKVS
jgi:hypothetical protein